MLLIEKDFDVNTNRESNSLLSYLDNAIQKYLSDKEMRERKKSWELRALQWICLWKAWEVLYHVSGSQEAIRHNKKCALTLTVSGEKYNEKLSKGIMVWYEEQTWVYQYHAAGWRMPGRKRHQGRFCALQCHAHYGQRLYQRWWERLELQGLLYVTRSHLVNSSLVKPATSAMACFSIEPFMTWLNKPTCAFCEIYIFRQVSERCFAACLNNPTLILEKTDNDFARLNTAMQAINRQKPRRRYSPTPAIEFDFGNNWAETVTQGLHYSVLTKKKAGIVLILETVGE